MVIRLSLIVSMLFSISFYGQLMPQLRGVVLDKKYESPVTTAVVTILDSSKSTLVNSKGAFVLEFWQSLPLDVRVSAIGYKDYYYTITSKEEWLAVLLEEEVTGLEEIVISASRAKETVFDSPVSIELFTTEAIENTTAATFFDGLENLKGVDVTSSSLNFKSVNTRGFSSIGNTRFAQLVDGMDSNAPGLNFSLGNFIGLNEIDVESVELLPGASSALYGANAFNGIMFMNSKSPFKYEGLSVYGKAGVTTSDNNGTNGFLDAGARVAKKITDRIALKFTASVLIATDWLASDLKDTEGRTSDTVLSFNGINIYGDGINVQGTDATRKGYAESDLVDPTANSFKTSFSAHFRPFEGDEDTELVYVSKFGIGNSIYDKGVRFALRDFIVHQHKLEFKNKHLLVRAYTTIDDSGDSYDIRLAADQLLSGSDAAFRNGYITELMNGETNLEARRIAEKNSNRLEEGSKDFKTAFNTIIKKSNSAGGARFVDKTKLVHVDANYSFKEYVEFADLQVGLSGRRYFLDSEGSIFTDAESSIAYNEVGIYTQLRKELLDKHLKLTGSIRYDKSDNFKGNFSPRLSVEYSLDADKKHKLRGSFQTAFRNPTAQEQYQGIELGPLVILGGAKGNAERYNKTFANGEFNGSQAYTNSYTASSVSAAGDALRAGTVPPGIVKADVDLLTTEQVQSYEIGYRGKVANNVEIDVATYYNKYSNFLNLATVVVPFDTSVDETTLLPALLAGKTTFASLYTNTDADVAVYGGNFGIKAKLNRDYNVGLSYVLTKQEFDEKEDPDFVTSFNTPEHIVKLSVGNINFHKGFGFGIDTRWQDAFIWNLAGAGGKISARTVVDAQVTYNIEKIKSKFKVGGTNITGNNYQSSFGGSSIGSQIYASWTSNF